VNRRQSKISSCMAIAFLTACSDPKAIKDLEARVKELEKTSASTTDRIQTLEIENLLRNIDSIAFLRPSDQGYSAVKFDLGIMTVRLTDVKPYANGSRVTLQFGNISGATIDGLKAKVDWGRVDEKGVALAEGEKTREITFEKKLMGSSWTSVPVTLEGVPPEQLGYVRVSDVSHSGILLAR
jgi:hypothetical protein